MVQVAKNRYASQQYHDFIGFQVSKPLLERTFPIIYGSELKDLLTHEDLAIGSYRFAVSRMIPQMTQIALRTHEKGKMKEKPDFAKKEFLYRLSRSEYEKEWGKDYTKPDYATRAWSVVLRYIPKIGPFKALAFNNPTPQTEDLYFKSINSTVDQYRVYLRQIGAGSLELVNTDFDTGKITKAAEYSLTDETYARLLSQLTQRKFDLTSTDLRINILDFYSDLSLPLATKRDSAKWQGLLSSRDQLKLEAPTPILASNPQGKFKCVLK